MNYDARKMPLGNLSKNTILKGFAALKVCLGSFSLTWRLLKYLLFHKDLADVLENPNGAKAKELGGLRNAYNTLSAQYYTVIPHDFGRNRPEAIDSKQKLKQVCWSRI
jgi:poly [ADP-ribose] polymerase